MDFGEDFFETPAGQTIAGAHRYLSAARVLRYSNEWGPLIQVPTLNLLGHGIELLFKFPVAPPMSSQVALVAKNGPSCLSLLMTRA